MEPLKSPEDKRDKETMKHSLDDEDLGQHAAGGGCHSEGAGRGRGGEGRHQAVDDVRHQSQENTQHRQRQPRLPAAAQRAPRGTSADLVLENGDGRVSGGVRGQTAAAL